MDGWFADCHGRFAGRDYLNHIFRYMTVNTIFQEAVHHVARTWPDDHQQIIGEAILDGVATPQAALPVIQLTDEERSMVDVALVDVEAGRIVSHETTQSVFAEYGA